MERFAKYHGLGNDFVILDRRAGGGPVAPELGRALCDRRRGVGADGVLTLLASQVAPARMQVTNAERAHGTTGARPADEWLLFD